MVRLEAAEINIEAHELNYVLKHLGWNLDFGLILLEKFGEDTFLTSVSCENKPYLPQNCDN